LDEQVLPRGVLLERRLGLRGLKHRIYHAGGVRVEFETISTGFLVTFYRPQWEQDKSLVAGGGKTTQKTAQKILSILRHKPSASRKELALEVGITEDGIKYQLARMQQKGSIKRIGPDKGGYWEVVT